MEDREELIRQLVNTGDVVIELGVAKGVFSDYILRNTKCKKLISVDSWAGDRGHDNKEMAECKKRLKKFGDRSEIHKATFTDFLALIEDNSIDFIYVHGYAHTANDNGKTFEQWWSKLKPKGVMAGHDYGTKFGKNKEAVERFCKRLRKKFYTTEDHNGNSSWYTLK